MKVKMLIGAAALALTAPALAQGDPASAPPVEDGDLACFIATGWLAMAAGKAADKPDQTPEKRAEALKLAANSYEDNSFYLGRMTMFGKDKLTQDLYFDAYSRFAKLSSKEKAAVIAVCTQWAKDAKLGVIKPWTSKP